ncbi:MAG: response regulator transcription factor [Ignavibacteriales bacterium]|nr:response regulator transcription factor [Ignavibacteriales bacterium]
MNQTPFSLWLIDDEAKTCAALQRSLQHDARVSEYRWFSSVQSARVFLEQRATPGIVLLDLHFPGEWGPDLIPNIRRCSPCTKIIILTVDRSPMIAVDLAYQRVDGFLLKPFRVTEVFAACERALQGYMPYDPEIIPHILASLPTYAPSPLINELTPMEQTLLPLIAKGWDAKQMSQQAGLSEHTVRTHLKHINQKLGTHSHSELIAKIHREHLHLTRPK